MIELIILIVGIFVLSGIFWHSIFYQKEKKLLNRLQQMLDCAIDGELERTEVSEEKYSALENSMKQHLDSSFLARKNQQEQKEVIQKLISDIAHQTLTPISNLKIYGEILSETNHENQEEIDTILEQTEKLDFLIQSLVKLSRMESGIIAVHSEDTTIAQMFASVQQQFNVKVREKNITLSLCDTDLHVRCDPKWTVEALGNIVDNAIKYTARGGKIKIKAGQYSFFVKIDITDKDIWTVLPKYVSDRPARSRNWLISCKRDYSGTKRVYKSDIRDRAGFYIFCFSPCIKNGIVSKL